MKLAPSSTSGEGRDPGGRRAAFDPRLVEGKTVKNRLHLDVNPTDREQDEEVRRLLDLGARHADVGQGDASWVVFADPEGNEFCVLANRRP
ncbi:MAG TPA: VOC family protein [Micromonosporaceae bacterium]